MLFKTSVGKILSEPQYEQPHTSSAGEPWIQGVLGQFIRYVYFSSSLPYFVVGYADMIFFRMILLFDKKENLADIYSTPQLERMIFRLAKLSFNGTIKHLKNK